MAKFILPTGTGDKDGIKLYAENVHDFSREYRWESDRTALRNILYFLGIQWIHYDPLLRIWRPLGLKRSTPRPVTNKVAPLINTAASNLVSFKPPITITPDTGDDKDVAAANVADRLIEVIERETHIRKLKPYIAKWVLLTGNCFLIPGYDNSSDTGTVFVPHERCVNCQAVNSPGGLEDNNGACPQCGVNAPTMPAMDDQDEPVGTDYPKGKFYTEVQSSFTCYFDPESMWIDQSPYFMVSELKTKDWVAQTYGNAVATAAQEETQRDPYTRYLETIAYTSALSGTVTSGVVPHNLPRVRVRRLWLRPQPATGLKEGLYATLIGDQVIEPGPWKYHDSHGDPMLNVVHLQFDQVPGRVLAKSRIDDIVPKQDQRNRIESIFELHSKRMANSLWLLPEGSNITRLSGEEGQIARYNALAGVPPPTRIGGTSPPPYLIEWMLQIDREMDEIFGSMGVGRGEAPKGVPSYAGIQLLDERAQQAQSGLMENWAYAFMEWGRINLNIWREYADEERTLALGEGAWAVQKFTKADLEGGVTLSMELGQHRPRTQIGARATVEQAVRLSLVSPFNPGERFRMLQILGVPELMEDYKLDTMLASQENDMFMAGQPVPPPQPWEGHAIHIPIHRKLLINPDVPQQVKAVVWEHMQATWQMMAQMAAAQQGPGQGAPGPGGPPGGAGGPSGDEGGMNMNDAQGASPDMGGSARAQRPVLGTEGMAQ